MNEEKTQSQQETESRKPTRGRGTPVDEAPSDQPHASTPGSTRNRPHSVSPDSGSADAAVKPGDISSMEELLRYAYGEAGKKLSAPKAVYATIDRKTVYPLGGEPAHVILDELAARDPLLAVPPRLLVHAADADVPFRLSQRLIDCVSYALRLHPVFRGKELQGVLTKTQEPGDVDVAFDLLKRAVRPTTELSGAEPGQELKDSERAKLRTNAVTALALVIARRDRWSVDRLVEVLYRHLWTSEGSAKGSLRASAAVADARSPEVLALVAGVFDRRVTQLKQDFDELSAQNIQLVNQRLEAEQESANKEQTIAELRSEVRGLTSKIAELEMAIEAERQGRLIDQSHHLADYEALRTRVVRLLGDQVDILVDGLHALKDNRLDTAEEFLDRSLGALTRERDRLKDGEAASR